MCSSNDCKHEYHFHSKLKICAENIWKHNLKYRCFLGKISSVDGPSIPSWQEIRHQQGCISQLRGMAARCRFFLNTGLKNATRGHQHDLNPKMFHGLQPRLVFIYIHIYIYTSIHCIFVHESRRIKFGLVQRNLWPFNRSSDNRTP